MEQIVQQKIREGYDFRTLTYVQQGIQNFASNWFQYICVAILGGIVSVLAQKIPGLGILSGFVITPLLTASMLIVAEKVYRKENTTFRDFLESTKHLGGLVLATILQILVLMGFMTLMVLVLMFPFISVIKDYDVSTNFMESGILFSIAGFVVLMVLFGVAIYAWYFFSYNYVVFGNMDGSKAMTFSRKIVMKQYGKIFMYLLSLTVLMVPLVAVVFYYSGQIEVLKATVDAVISKDLEAINALNGKSNLTTEIVTAAAMSIFSPIAHCINQAAFRDIHGLENDETIDNTIDHFVVS